MARYPMSSSSKGAIIGGCLGILIMIALIESDVEAAGFWLVLWPSAMFGSLHGEGGGIFGLVVGGLEVGVQFLTWSALGWIVGAAVRIARREG
jgi:hypothetical protein